MTLPAWDLDAPMTTERVAATPQGRPVIMLAVGLACLGLGGLVGSSLSPAGAPRSPTTATLTIRDLYVDTSGPASVTTPGPTGLKSLVGNAVVVLRLQVDNPGTGPVRLTAIELDGVTRTPNVVPLNLAVAGHSSVATDLTVHPDCSLGREPGGLRARLRLTGRGEADPESVWVAPSRSLSVPGGLCSQLNLELPNGWRAPLQANATRLQGIDLEVTVGDLSGARLAGIMVDNQLLPTVFVGDDLLSSSAQVRPGEATQLRLRGPPPCFAFSGSAPIPTTLRLLAVGDRGVEQRLVIVGPALTHWLRLDCSSP